MQESLREDRDWKQVVLDIYTLRGSAERSQLNSAEQWEMMDVSRREAYSIIYAHEG